MIFLKGGSFTFDEADWENQQAISQLKKLECIDRANDVFWIHGTRDVHQGPATKMCPLGEIDIDTAGEPIPSIEERESLRSRKFRSNLQLQLCLLIELAVICLDELGAMVAMQAFE